MVRIKRTIVDRPSIPQKDENPDLDREITLEEYIQLIKNIQIFPRVDYVGRNKDSDKPLTGRQ